MVLSIVVIFLICQQVKANSEQQAVKAASEAFYKQTGMDSMVNGLKKKYVPKTVQQVSGWLVVGYDMVARQEIKYVWEWTF